MSFRVRSQGEDPRRLPGGGATPTPPEPVQVQWPQTVAVIFNPSSGGDTAREGSDHIREAIEATGKPEAIDEERRLLYVALSRAERYLHLSWAKGRTRGSRLANRTKSPYLIEVERVIGDSLTGDPLIE